MTKEQFIDFLKNEKKLDQSKIDLLLKYKEFLQEENKVTNLTRLDKEDIVYDSFFLESIKPFWEINFNPESNQKLLDIGSGSGIPGVLLKILYPNLSVSLIESNNKKVSFLTKLINHLRLENIEVIYGRCEEIIRNNNLYETYDYVTSRAVSSLHNILELSAGFVKVNGLIIEPKSRKSDEEYNNALKVILNTNLALKQKVEYSFNQKENTIFVFTKTKEINKKYPRTWNQIIKDENISNH